MGEDGRIWKHEEAATKINEEVKAYKAAFDEGLSDEAVEALRKTLERVLIGKEAKAYKVAFGKTLSDEDVKAFRKTLKRDFSEKYEKIKALGPENVTKVIVKCGLTNHEAYMVESALINMYKFMYENMYEKKLVEGALTNIANGHRSKKEKENRPYETKAQTIKDFEKNCGDPEPFSAILDEYRKHTEKDIKTPNDGCGVLFVKINNLYPLCKSSENETDAILDAASGFWEIGKKRLEKIEYVFALYQSKIVGIYYVNRDEGNWLQKKDLRKIDIDNKKAVAILKETKKQLPFILREEVRREEYDKINKQLKRGALEKGNIQNVL